MVVVTVDYPGASPEVVESEVTKPLEEAINSISGINALTSRSYEGKSVIIIEFQLHMDGRKAADDVREKVATVRPTLRDEVKEPWVLRFDPASAPVWSVAVLPNPATLPEGAQPLTPIQLTTWADQVLKNAWKTCAAWVPSIWWAVHRARSISIWSPHRSKPMASPQLRWCRRCAAKTRTCR